jgi:hypothetical protein
LFGRAHGLYAQRSRSATRRHWSAIANQSAIAGFAASGLFGDVFIVLSEHMDADEENEKPL